MEQRFCDRWYIKPITSRSLLIFQLLDYVIFILSSHCTDLVYFYCTSLCLQKSQRVLEQGIGFITLLSWQTVYHLRIGLCQVSGFTGRMLLCTPLIIIIIIASFDFNVKTYFVKRIFV